MLEIRDRAAAGLARDAAHPSTLGERGSHRRVQAAQRRWGTVAATALGKASTGHGWSTSGWEEIRVSKDLSDSANRKKLKESSFALPEREKYPIPDIDHGRNALARVAQSGSEAERGRSGRRSRRSARA